MKKIGVLSDTHLSTPSGVLQSIKSTLRTKRTLTDLRTLITQHFHGVDLIIHTGDFVDIAVLEMLQEFAPVEAVYGNMDPPSLRAALPEKNVLHIEGFTIGITHGSGAPTGMLDRVKTLFPDVDAIVFGHTHHPLNEVRNGVLFFNPGSPTDRIFAPYNSLGVLEIGETISGHIVRV